MSRSLLARIEALELASGMRSDPLYIIFRCFSDGDRLHGYEWEGGRVVRKPGESEEAIR